MTAPTEFPPIGSRIRVLDLARGGFQWGTLTATSGSSIQAEHIRPLTGRMVRFWYSAHEWRRAEDDPGVCETRPAVVATVDPVRGLAERFLQLTDGDAQRFQQWLREWTQRSISSNRG